MLSRLSGDPHKSKTYVGNRVAQNNNRADFTRPMVACERGCMDNPGDCASRGLLPSELLDYDLWWNGPSWLLQTGLRVEERASQKDDMGMLTCYSSLYEFYVLYTTVVHDFVTLPSSGPLSVAELTLPEMLWLSGAQTIFSEERWNILTPESIGGHLNNSSFA